MGDMWIAFREGGRKRSQRLKSTRDSPEQNPGQLLFILIETLSWLSLCLSRNC